MKRRLAATVTLMLLCALSAPSQSQTDIGLINKFIATQAAQERGVEYGDARKIVVGDLNADGTEDLAVLYTIEGQDGTNNYAQYLAVFLRVKGRLVSAAHIGIGGKFNRAVELQSISKGVILLQTLKYAPQDASCCPSLKGRARYVLVNRKLKPLRGQVQLDLLNPV